MFEDRGRERAQTYFFVVTRVTVKISLYSPKFRADLESTQRSGFGMWLLRHDDFLHIVSVFVPENISSFLPKLFAAR